MIDPMVLKGVALNLGRHSNLMLATWEADSTHFVVWEANLKIIEPGAPKIQGVVAGVIQSNRMADNESPV